jgi:hypothetical protein
LVIVPAFGCAPDFPSGSPDGGGGGSDSMTPDAQLCFGSFVKVCFDSMADVPVAARTLAGEIDTDNSPLCDPSASILGSKTTYCVVSGMGLTVATGTTVRGFGKKPLVLLSTAGFDLSGGIDVSSTSANTTSTQANGAGANPDVCLRGRAAVGNAGGYGASFGERGGDGESRDGGQGIPPDPSVVFPEALRGGCPGGAGSILLPPDVGGTGGSGGGAVAIIASQIQLNDGRINASGAGGHGGPQGQSGGGGGGSGGMIVLDAPTMAGAGQVFANGGGGAQGGTGGGPGIAGIVGGESSGPTSAASGGGISDGGAKGGFGGSGSSGTRLTGFNAAGGASGMGGGGGGGGAAGFIRAPASTVAMAPPPL